VYYFGDKIGRLLSTEAMSIAGFASEPPGWKKSLPEQYPFPHAGFQQAG
jgi:hypothetical protein